MNKNILLLIFSFIISSCSTINQLLESGKNDKELITDQSCRLVQDHYTAEYCVYKNKNKLSSWQTKDSAKRELASLKNKNICQ